VSSSESYNALVLNLFSPFGNRSTAVRGGMLVTEGGDMSRNGCRKSAEFGGAFVEAAMVTPLLIMLLVSIMQFGYVFGIQTNLRGASAIAARAAVLGSGQTSQQVCNTAYNSIANIVDASQVTCETSPSVLPAAPNSPVTITLRYPVPLLASQAGFIKGPTLTLSAATTMQ
jgi:Flp pilus assembly protein TadG